MPFASAYALYALIERDSIFSSPYVTSVLAYRINPSLSIYVLANPYSDEFFNASYGYSTIAT